jgi:predicted nucleic acid-binding protein
MMVYVDSSVFIAHLLAEDRRPGEELWLKPLASSRLLEVEAWNRLHSRGLSADLAPVLRTLLGRLAIIEMEPNVLSRALEPFPIPVRTLDAIHLASADYLRRLGEDISIATYDARMAAAAREMDFETIELD